MGRATRAITGRRRGGRSGGAGRIKITMPDLAAFESELENFRTRILEDAQKMMAFSGRRIVRNSRKAAPVKTGALKRSLKDGFHWLDKDKLTYVLKPIDYAVFVEFVPPRIPFLWPAYLKEKQYIPRTIKRNMKKVTKEIAQKITRRAGP